MKPFGKIKNLLSDERFQIIYGVVLIILIPFVIIFNAVSIIGRYNNSIDVALQRQALLMGRSFHALTIDDLNKTASLQEKIDRIHATSPDVLELQILRPSDEGFTIIASTNQEVIQSEANFYYYALAWQQPANDALATDSLLLSTIDDEINPDILVDQGRFWLVSMPLRDSNNNKVALLSMKLSSGVVDELTNSTWRASLVSLALTILITILFLAASTRLWGYASLYNKIKELDKMKDEFVSMASHELRTPITAIRGYISMMLDGSLGQISSQMKHSLHQMEGSSEHLGRLVGDLLDVSRIEQGRLQLTMQTINPSQIIKSTIDQLHLTAKNKNLELKLEQSEELSKISVDRDKLKQALVNIIGNAIKYTEKGKVTVNTAVSDKKFRIHVQDTGIGISPDAQKRLFEKFYRVKNSKTNQITGTGLGLWITKKIIELMHGRILVESIEGTGTKVTIEFPVHTQKQ